MTSEDKDKGETRAEAKAKGLGEGLTSHPSHSARWMGHPAGRSYAWNVLAPGLLLFAERSQAGFVDLQDDAGVAVGYLADVVFGGGAEDLGCLGLG